MSEPLPPIKYQIPLGTYEHYSGKRCSVIGVARHSETLEEMVVYTELGDGNLWVRPAAMFVEDVEVKGKIIPRFRFLQ